MSTEYDVYISHKNLGSDAQPTKDAGLARELYDHLTGHGLRVFLSNVSLEQLGTAAYKKAIDEALDAAQVLVAVGTSTEHLESLWVRYEWESFFSDVLSGRKPKARVFSYISGIDVNSLPRTLRQNQAIVHAPGAQGLLYNFITNALAIQSVSKITHDGTEAVNRLHKLVELMAESRLLELEITAGMFGTMFTGSQRERMKCQIEALKRLTHRIDAAGAE